MREVGTGVVALLLAIITYALGAFVYYHRVSLTVEDKEARDAAIGLTVVFGALMIRSTDLWLHVVSERLGIEWLAMVTGSPATYLFALVAVILGVMMTVKAFHPWPVWALLITAAVSVPVVVSFVE